MTGNHDKLRSLFLVALMVMSVFAMTVAFTGGAAAEAVNTSPEVQSAVEDDDEIEVAFNTDVEKASGIGGNLDDENFTVVVNGDEQSPTGVAGGGDNYVLSGDWDTLNPVDDVTLEIDTVNTTAGAENSTEIGEVDVDVTSQTISEGDAEQGDPPENRVYLGEVIALETADEGGSLEVGEVGDTGSVLDNGSPTDNATRLAFDTEARNLETGTDYVATFDGANEQYFNVSSLNLGVSAPNETWDDEDLEVDVSAAAANRGLTGELLDDDGDTVDTVGGSLDGSAEATLNFSTVEDAGNYTVEVTDNQTGVTAESDSIAVSDRGDSAITFTGGNVVTEDTGDIANFTLDFQNADTGTVVIGNNESVNYYISANVTAPSEDSEVTLQFNTYTAGVINGSDDDNNLYDGEDVLWSDTEDAEVDVQTQKGEFVDNNTDADNAEDNHEGAVQLEASSDYSTNVSVGHNHWNNSDEWTNPSDVGTLSLVENTSENLTAHVAPRDQMHDSVDPLWAGLGTNVTENDELAHNDVLVLVLEETGLEGEIESQYENATDAIVGPNSEIEHTNPGTNAGERDMEVGYANTTVAADYDNDTYFIQIDTDEVDDTGVDRDYNATTFSGQYEEFSVVEPTSELETEQVDEEPWVTANPEDNQSFAGETNVAPGSNVTTYLQSRSSDSPFLITPTATVQADGTFEATTDEFADRVVGTEFDASTRIDNNVLGEIQDGVIQEPATPSPTPEPTTEPPTETTEPPTETTEAMDTTEDPDSPTPTEGDGPGFGIAVSLIALIGAALLAARRFN